MVQVFQRRCPPSSPCHWCLAVTRGFLAFECGCGINVDVFVSVWYPCEKPSRVAVLEVMPDITPWIAVRKWLTGEVSIESIRYGY